VYKLGSRSIKRLEGVHPDLVKVVERAIEISEIDFTVLEGRRTYQKQKEYYAAGKTTTMNSRHLTGHAVDLAPWPISWAWPKFHLISNAMFQAADELVIPLQWGGHWKSFPDGPHHQLPWSEYS